MHLVMKLFFLIAAIRWGDWRNWQKYYPTILFFILMDLFYNYLLYEYPMWEFHEGDIPVLHYEVFIVLSFIIVRYPATILIYLGNFPAGKLKSIFWITFWVLLYTIVEVIDLYLGLISHHNGWNLGWSILFNVVMFLTLKIHYHKPLLAWCISIIWILFLWNVFDIPMDVLKK
ncbi:CBO0543 family protein [Virgibacillus sp. DJP39]|uniref:CBO0543 family protein n=1 Tax=Virgibacillus sp. DJP39 TaxID=3409790 RepID=UPI003BB6D863